MSMRKSAPLILVLSLAFAPLASGDDFLQGLLHLEKGNYQEAGKQLEAYFERETDIDKKAKTAMVLAFAEGKELKNMPVYYGKYALKYYPDLTVDKKLKIHRRIGDYYFEIGDLKNAMETYQILISDSLEIDPKIYDYAVYKMGWALINDGQYEKAFDQWIKHLNSHKEALLRENMIRDFGKFWAEYTYEKGKFPVLRPSLETEQEKIAFLEGLKDGHLRGYRKNPELFFELAKAKGPLGPELSIILKTQTSFLTDPCGLLTWNKANSINVLDEEALGPYLAKCSSADQKSQIKLDQGTLNFLSSLSWSPTNQVVLGVLFGAREQKGLACTTFINGSSTSLSLQESLVIMEGILKNCTELLSELQLNQISQFTSSILSLEEFQKQSKTEKKVTNTLVAFLSSTALSGVLGHESVRKHPYFIESGPIRLALLDAYSENSQIFPILFETWPHEDVTSQESLSKHLIWAIEQKLESHYLSLLEKYNEQQGAQVPLLYLASLNVPLPSTLAVKADQLMKDLQGKCNSLSALGRQVFLNLAFTKQDFGFVLDNWACLEKDVLSNAKIASRVLGMIIQKENEIGKERKNMNSIELLRYGILIGKMGRGEVSSRALNMATPKVIKNEKIVKDIDLLKKTAKFKEAIPGKKGLSEATLVKILQKAMTLQKSLSKRVWESQEIMGMTTQIYNQEIERLKANIEQRKDLSLPKEQLTKAFENLRLSL